MRFLLSIFLLGTPLLANTTLQVTGVTARQATLAVRTDQTGNCTYRISESQALTPLVNDVNPNLFPGADTDQRPGSVVSGQDHYFVAGTNGTATLGDGLTIKSRALAANTHHWGQVTCGADTVPFEFTTANSAYGNNYPELAPFNPTAFGNTGWPTQDWTTLTPAFDVDPTTGFKVKRVTSPGWFGRIVGPVVADLAIDAAGSWTNAANATSGSAATLATYSGAADAGNYLFLPFNLNAGPQGSNQNSWQSGWSVDDMLLRVFGSASAPGTVLSACIVYWDSQTCNSGTLTLNLPASAGTSTMNDQFPAFPFAGWGGKAPIRTSIESRTGPVAIADTKVTFNASEYSPYQYANILWQPGALIRIVSGTGCAGGIYTIASVDSATQVTLTSPAGTCTDGVFQSLASGVKIWKSAGTGSVNISVNFDFAWSTGFSMPAQGSRSVCSPVSVTDSSYTGQPIHLCVMPNAANETAGYVAFGFVPSTGEIRFLGPLYRALNSSDPPSDQFNGNMNICGGCFDGTDGRTFYAYSLTGSSAYISAVKITYTGNFTPYGHPMYAPVGFSPGQDPGIPYPNGPYSDVGFTYTNITKHSQGKDILTQLAALNAQYDAGVFGNPGAGTTTIYHSYGSQLYGTTGVNSYGESIALWFVIDANTGTMTLTGDNFSGPFPARWGSLHAQVPVPGYLAQITNTLGGNNGFAPQPTVSGAGPHQTTPSCVYKSGLCNPDTSLTATAPLDSCAGRIPDWLRAAFPAYTFGNKCMMLQLQNPVSHTPTAVELAKWPSRQNPAWSKLTDLQPGDRFVINSGENLLVLGVRPIPGVENYEVDVYRGFCNNPDFCVPKVQATGWKAAVLPPGDSTCSFGGCTPGIGLFADSTQTGSTMQWNLYADAFAGHGDIAPGPTSGATTTVTAGLPGSPHRVAFNTPLTQQFVDNFASANSLAVPNAFNAVPAGGMAQQSYPSLRHTASADKTWFVDDHAANGSVGLGQEHTSAVCPVAYSLVNGTTSVWKFTTPCGAINAATLKSLPVAAFAGANMLQDVSGATTGDIISDATPWKFCAVLHADECRSGSAVGEIYATVPQASTNSNCITGFYTINYPCAYTVAPTLGKMVQVRASTPDPMSQFWRPIGMGLSNIGRTYQFATAVPDATGSCVFSGNTWLDGQRPDLVLTCVPSSPPVSAASRAGFVPVDVQVESATAYAEVQFGYSENGGDGTYYCTSRAENCNTSGTPFSFDSDSRTLKNCAGGCTITVPAIPGRTLYYRIGQSDDGSTWTYGPAQPPVAIP